MELVAAGEQEGWESWGQWGGQTLTLTEQVRRWNREVTACSVVKEKCWSATTEIFVHSEE